MASITPLNKGLLLNKSSPNPTNTLNTNKQLNLSHRQQTKYKNPLLMRYQNLNYEINAKKPINSSEYKKYLACQRQILEERANKLNDFVINDFNQQQYQHKNTVPKVQFQRAFTAANTARKIQHKVLNSARNLNQQITPNITPIQYPSENQNFQEIKNYVIDLGKLQTTVEDYVIGKIIGQGTYAVCKLAIHKTTNKKLAMKIYDKYKLIDPTRKKSVKREIQVMQIIDHPNIVKLFGTINNSKALSLLMEYVTGPSLHGYLKKRSNRKLDELEAKIIFKQIIQALQYCHSKCITHRDIKLENILLDEHKNVKLIDFGFSTLMSNDQKIKMFCGTPSYMAPEIAQKKEYAGPPVDIWACGVLLFAMLCGYFPFKGFNDRELFRKIIPGTFNIPDHVSKLASNLIKRILQVNPSKRLTADQILQDSWLTNQQQKLDPIPNQI